jgi:hypothetical protein
MSATTGFEHVMRQAEASLVAAGIRVCRNQAGDEASPEDCPLVVLRRRGSRRAPDSPIGRDYHQQGFELQCCVAAADWEAAADALHARAHAALTANPDLSAMGLQLEATEPDARSGAVTVGKLQAFYTLTPVLSTDLQLI